MTFATAWLSQLFYIKSTWAPLWYVEFAWEQGWFAFDDVEITPPSGYDWPVGWIPEDWPDPQYKEHNGWHLHTMRSTYKAYDDERAYSVTIHVCGFPFNALRRVSAEHTSGSRIGIINPNWTSIRAPWYDRGLLIRKRGWLFFRPRPLLFAGNTAFYALIWLIPATVVNDGRLRRRRKRGLCERCGYSLEGLTGERCPECSAPLTQKTPN